MKNLEVNQKVLDFARNLVDDVNKLDFSYTESETNGNCYTVSLHTTSNIIREELWKSLKEYFSDFTYYSLDEVYNEVDYEDYEDDEFYDDSSDREVTFSHNHLFFSFKTVL